MPELISFLNDEERDELSMLEEKMSGTTNLDQMNRYQTKWIILLEKAKLRMNNK